MINYSLRHKEHPSRSLLVLKTAGHWTKPRHIDGSRNRKRIWNAHLDHLSPRRTLGSSKGGTNVQAQPRALLPISFWNRESRGGPFSNQQVAKLAQQSGQRRARPNSKVHGSTNGSACRQKGCVGTVACFRIIEEKLRHHLCCSCDVVASVF